MHPVLLSPAIRQVSLDIMQIPATSALVCTLTSIVISAHLHCMSLDRQPVRAVVKHCHHGMPCHDKTGISLLKQERQASPLDAVMKIDLLMFEHHLVDTRLVHLSHDKMHRGAS